MMKRTTIFIPAQLELRARAEARRRGVSKAEVVRMALESFLETGEELPKWVGSITFPSDGVNSSNVKSWLREQYAKKANARS